MTTRTSTANLAAELLQRLPADDSRRAIVERCARELNTATSLPHDMGARIDRFARDILEAVSDSLDA